MAISQHDMNSKINITLLSLFAELERDLISLRAKEALKAKKAQGITLGKPKGTIQKSKFDVNVEKINELLNYPKQLRNNNYSLTVNGPGKIILTSEHRSEEYYPGREYLTLRYKLKIKRSHLRLWTSLHAKYLYKLVQDIRSEIIWSFEHFTCIISNQQLIQYSFVQGID